MNFEFSPEEKIQGAKIRLNQTHPFFSYILLSMKATEENSIPTMAVNAYGDLFYNAEFTDRLSPEELNFVVAHESMHMATLSFPRQGNRDQMLWNMATDYAINLLLIKEGMTPPKDVLLPDANGDIEVPSGKGKKKRYNIEKKNAEQIYDILYRHIKVIKEQMGCGDGSYTGALDGHLPDDQDPNGNSTGKDTSDAGKAHNENYWKQKATDAAVKAKSRGKLPGELERLVGELNAPKIDWRRKLMQFITREIPVDYTMRSPGRRFHATGIYMPSVIRENLEVMIYVDVSGSIGDHEYKEFMSEIVGICTGYEQVKARVIYWSTYVDERDDIEVTRGSTKRLLAHKVHNSGGTEISCCKRYVEEKGYNSRIHIFLTDGYIEHKPVMPNGQCLFVLSTGSTDEIVKHYGDVSHLDVADPNEY
jgi:predicted metal-dependent peptidase